MVSIAVASAMPSITPTVNALAPRVVTRNIGNRLCTSSEDRSMNKLTKPKAQTVEGIRTEAGLGFERLSMRVSGIECSPIVYVANPGDQALKILTQKKSNVLPCASTAARWL